MSEQVIESTPQTEAPSTENMSATQVWEHVQSKLTEELQPQNPPDPKVAPSVEPVVEAAPETPAPPKPVEDTYARKLRLLKEQERALRIQREDFDKKAQAASGHNLDALRELAKHSPTQAIQQLGIDPDAYLDRLASGDPEGPSEIDKFRTEFEKERDEIRREAQELRSFRVQQKLAEHRTNLERFLENSEKHPLTKAGGGSDLVWTVIQTAFSETGVAPTYEEAADIAEKMTRTLVERVLTDPKAKELFASQSQAPEQVTPSQKKTLTNQMSSETPSIGLGDEFDNMSPDDPRLIAAFTEKMNARWKQQ